MNSLWNFETSTTTWDRCIDNSISPIWHYNHVDYEGIDHLKINDQQSLSSESYQLPTSVWESACPFNCDYGGIEHSQIQQLQSLLHESNQLPIPVCRSTSLFDMNSTSGRAFTPEDDLSYDSIMSSLMLNDIKYDSDMCLFSFSQQEISSQNEIAKDKEDAILDLKDIKRLSMKKLMFVQNESNPCSNRLLRKVLITNILQSMDNSMKYF